MIVDVNWVFDGNSLDHYWWGCLVVVIIGSHFVVEFSDSVVCCFRVVAWAQLGTLYFVFGVSLESFLATFGITHHVKRLN